ncbi:MAG TPA: glycosyltransferase family 39 protein [Pyrinomonadaceae bacterium]|nr:glycosyltransferase family 39 protein [Pyrinomonadaceae bacterium]
MEPSTLAKRRSLLLFVPIFFFYLYGLGYLPLVGPDEPRYAQVAREMFARHDLITPTLGWHTWFEKPVLLYWGMMAGYKVFGVSEWSARLGPALSGILTILAVWWIARRIERITQRAGFAFLSTLVIASSGGLIVFSRGASFDIVITMTLTWALSFFLAQELETKNRNWFLAAFYVFVGLSLLAKGLIGIVLPAGIIGCFYVFRLRWPLRHVLISMVWGIPLALLVAGVWYGPVIARHGWLFINEFFIQHHFARYFSNKYQHPQPIYFYLPVLLILTLPWTVFLLDSLIKARTWNRQIDEVTKITRLFGMAWLVVPVVFFSFSGSKLPAYILPSLSAAALLTGDRLTSFLREENGIRVMRITGFACLALAIAGGIFAHSTGKISVACVVAISTSAALISILIIFLAAKRLTSIVMAALIPFVVCLIALNCAVGSIGARESVRDLIRSADAAGYGNSPLAMFNRIDRSSEFYATGRVVYAADGDPLKVDNPEEILAQLKKANGPLLLIVPLGSLANLEAIKAVQTIPIADNGRNAIVAIRTK